MARLPDARGHFGRFGGRFVPEVLMAPLLELEKAYAAARRDRKFQRRLHALLADYAGRPTPLYHAARLTEHCGGAHAVRQHQSRPAAGRAQARPVG